MHENENIMAEKDRINLDSFIIHGLIGKGSFWEVYLVERKENDFNYYAMKIILVIILKFNFFFQILNVFTKENNLIKYVLTERNGLSLKNHAFNVKLLWAFQISDKLFLIMDFCPWLVEIWVSICKGKRSTILLFFWFFLLSSSEI